MYDPIWMLKESRYVKMANTMYRVLKNSRIPLFLHRKSNHVFTMWQHLVLLTIRQDQGKSYRMFVEWLIELITLDYFWDYHVFLILRHCRSLQTELKYITEKIISSFIVISGTRRVFVGNRFDRIQRLLMLHSIIPNEQDLEENMRNYLLE